MKSSKCNPVGLRYGVSVKRRLVFEIGIIALLSAPGALATLRGPATASQGGRSGPEALSRPTLAEVERQHVELARRVSPAVVAILLKSHPASGVFISSQGHILTCDDVLPKSAEEIKVRLFGGRTLQAKVLKRYPEKNLAVLQVPGADYAHLPLLDVTPEAGTLVVAVGNTQGVHNDSDQSACHVGVVSGVFAPEGDVGAGTIGQLIETDAGVNPGSFGGALVDVDGHLLGILSSLYSERRWLGTAIPIHEIVEELKRDFEIPMGETTVSSSMLKDLASSFQEAAGKVAPSVVTVKAERSGNRSRVPRSSVEKRYQMRPEAGTASGVIVDSDGYVMTTYFNIEKADTLSVILPDGRSLGALLVGTDQQKDLALLKVEAKGLPVPEWAPKGSLRVGHWTVVVGRDRPHEPISISTGIVSALGRFQGNAFETDAQVNYGNAGGAVVDGQGRVVGIAARITTDARHGINSGVAFAVPGDRILDGLPQLKEGAMIQVPPAPFLGIAFKNNEDEIDGVYVDRILPNSGAAESDLKAGDVVIGMEEKEVFTRSDFLEQIRERKPGDIVRLRVRRGEEKLTVSLTVGKRPRR